jgi:hypothetical protein
MRLTVIVPTDYCDEGCVEGALVHCRVDILSCHHVSNTNPSVIRSFIGSRDNGGEVIWQQMTIRSYCTVGANADLARADAQTIYRLTNSPLCARLRRLSVSPWWCDVCSNRTGCRHYCVTDCRHHRTQWNNQVGAGFLPCDMGEMSVWR